MSMKLVFCWMLLGTNCLCSMWKTILGLYCQFENTEILCILIGLATAITLSGFEWTCSSHSDTCEIISKFYLFVRKVHFNGCSCVVFIDLRISLTSCWERGPYHPVVDILFAPKGVKIYLASTYLVTTRRLPSYCTLRRFWKWK